MNRILTVLFLACLSINQMAAQCDVLNFSVFSISCAGSNDGVLTVDFSGSNLAFPATYQLTGPVTRLDSFSTNLIEISNLFAGDYTLSYTDANNCTNQISIQVAEPTPLDIILVGVTDVSCFGSADGSATAEAVGGVGGYTYQWSDGSTAQTSTGLPAGTYIVTVTDANGCIVERAFTINEPSPVTVLVTVERQNCDSLGGTLVVTASGGFPPYAYVWSNGAVGDRISGLEDGVYSVTVVDSNGCGEAIEAIVTGGGMNGLLGLVSNVSQITCFGNCDGFISLTASCGVAPYTYDWNDDQYDGQSNLTGLCAGTYEVIVRGVNGDSVTRSFVLEENLLALELVELNSPDCWGLSNGDVIIGATGGNAPYFYRTAAGGLFLNGPNLQNLSAGMYSSTVTDASGCTASLDFQLDEPDQLVMEIEVLNEACNGDGTLRGNVIGGTLPYLYIWTNYATGERIDDTSGVITNLEAGDYLLEVIDANGCVNEREITLDGFIGLELSSTPAGCDSTDGTATAMVNGGGTYTYAWSNGGTGPTQSGLAVGGYSVTVVDQNSGCRVHKNVLVRRDSSCYVLISGYVYSDVSVCQPDSNQAAANMRVVLNNGAVDYTNVEGYYEFRVDSVGMYTIQVEYDSIRFSPLCADPILVNAATYGQSYTDNNFYFSLNVLRNLKLKLSKPNPRPGFTRNVRICVMNHGNMPENATLTYMYDSLHIFTGANFNPTSHDTINRKLVWNFPTLQPGPIIVINVSMKLPATVPLGTQIAYYFKLDPDSGDIDLSDNEVYCTRTVVGSYDPNDKAVLPAGRGSNGLLDFDDEQLEYLVRFQNTGTDTAFTVVIRDTLDRDINLASIVPGPSSHPYDLTVYDSNVLEFTFNNILLPDSTTNEKESHGFVFFEADLPPDAEPGTRIENTAAIFFDYNAPIITNTVVSTVRAENDTTVLFLTGCGSIEYNGQVYTNNTTIIDTFEVAINDSIVIANLDIQASDFMEVTDTYCEGENPLPPGNYVDSLINQVGCDSIINREVIVLPNFNVNVTIPLQSGAVYMGQTYFNDTTFIETFTASNGCDSIVTIMIDIVTSTKDYLIDQAEFHVFPNPTTGLLQVEIKGIETGLFQLQIQDITGRSLSAANALPIRPGEIRQLDLNHLPDGVYTILLQSANGVKAHRVVKI